MNKLNNSEKSRYHRHLILPNFGMEGQLKLKSARVLVVGAGGLGCPVLQYLVAAGVGNIGIVDFDVVDESNLQRQILYSVDDVGLAKVEVAKRKLLALNPHINITTFQEKLTNENIERIFENFDIIADGTDNFDTRYLINDACVLLNKISVFGSVFRFEGQVAVFNYLQKDGNRSTNYRDLYPEPPEAGLIPNCAEGGVLGVLPGIIGSMQANEVIKVITGIGEPLVNQLYVFDASDLFAQTLKIKKNPNVNITHLPKSLDVICTRMVSTISAKAVKKMIAEKVDFQLIDVREQKEYDLGNIGGELIPLGTILENQDKISKDKQVVIHCQSGKRSQKAIELLEEAGFENLWNLEGGILAYFEDSALEYDNKKRPEM
ncbi:MAG: molybdopterin-synthase adenylyltransferase MoeB [Saprospiraceae bacterium]